MSGEVIHEVDVSFLETDRETTRNQVKTNWLGEDEGSVHFEDEDFIKDRNYPLIVDSELDERIPDRVIDILLNIDDICRKHGITLLNATAMKHPNLEHYYCHFYRTNSNAVSDLGMCRIVLDSNKPTISFYDYANTLLFRTIDDEVSNFFSSSKEKLK